MKFPSYFKRGSAAHVLLLIAQSEKKWFTRASAAYISPVLTKPSTAKDAAAKLERLGFIESKHGPSYGQAITNYWRITPRGKDYLRQFALANPSPYALV